MPEDKTFDIKDTRPMMNSASTSDNLGAVKEDNFSTEQSKWEQALSHVDKGENDDAIKLLNELVLTNGSYKDKAETLLLQLQN